MGDDLILPFRPTNRRDLGDAWHGEQAAAHDCVGNGSQLQRILRLRRNREEQNLAHDRRDRCQHRTLHLGREGSADERQLFGDDLSREEDVRPPVEFHPHDGDAECGGGSDAPDIRGAIDRAFKRERDE